MRLLERMRRFWALAAAVGLAAIPAHAGGEARYFRTVSQADFLAGTLAGIAIDPLGNLSLADRVERVADLGEPFLFSMAEHPSGWVVGTGNDGKVLLVGRDGSVETLFSAEEPEIFAVWARSDGTVFAGSSPNGKVYRIRQGVSEVFFAPEETYIWALAEDSAGRLLVATGTEGRLYRVTAAGDGSVVYDGEDTHVRAIHVTGAGDVLLGTAGEGLVLRMTADGEIRTLYDGAEPEVVALAEGPSGSFYAALLASEASFVDLAKTRNGGQSSGDDGKSESESAGNGQVKVSVAADAQSGFSGSRPASFSGARSVVLRVSATGLVEPIWTFDSETVYSLRWHRDRLWVGTGLDGKLYSFQDGKMVLEKDVDERQIVALGGGRPGPAFATTNAAAVFSVSTKSEPKGTYTSATLDAGQIARFGTLAWRGRLPREAKVLFSARSGMSSEPDRTWSSWSSATEGRELSLSAVPRARFVQWRAELEAANGEEPTVTEVVVSYVQENLAPRIETFEALGPGEVYVPANFNPGSQVFEPANPSRGGIFTTLQPAAAKSDRKKKLWKKGFQTLTWKAKDPNDDDLVYSLRFRRDGSESEWLPMAEDLKETSYGFDASALPDGSYRFLLEAADRRSQVGEGRLTAERTSEPVVIDNSAPRLVASSAKDGQIEVEIADALSPLRSARMSLDAGEWVAVAASDGLLDGRREKLTIEAEPAARLVLLQVMDAAFNVVTFDLSQEAK